MVRTSCFSFAVAAQNPTVAWLFVSMYGTCTDVGWVTELESAFLLSLLADDQENCPKRPVYWACIGLAFRKWECHEVWMGDGEADEQGWYGMQSVGKLSTLYFW